MKRRVRFSEDIQKDSGFAKPDPSVPRLPISPIGRQRNPYSIIREDERSSNVRDLVWRVDSIPEAHGSHRSEDISPTWVQELQRFREEHWQDCHAVPLGCHAGDLDLDHHTCFHHSILDHRFFPIPVSTGPNGLSVCNACHKTCDECIPDATTFEVSVPFGLLPVESHPRLREEAKLQQKFALKHHPGILIGFECLKIHLASRGLRTVMPSDTLALKHHI